MNNNTMRDVADYLTDIQQINFNIAVVLRNLRARCADHDLQAHLTTLAAASELLSDKAATIIDIMPDEGAPHVG